MRTKEDCTSKFRSMEHDESKEKIGTDSDPSDGFDGADGVKEEPHDTKCEDCTKNETTDGDGEEWREPRFRHDFNKTFSFDERFNFILKGFQHVFFFFSRKVVV